MHDCVSCLLIMCASHGNCPFSDPAASVDETERTIGREAIRYNSENFKAHGKCDADGLLRYRQLLFAVVLPWLLLPGSELGKV